MTNCKTCHKDFDDVKVAGRSKVYCSKRCKDLQEMRRRREENALRYSLLPFSRMRTCLFCGMMFHTKPATKQCCSRSCAGKLKSLSTGEGVKVTAYTCRHCGKTYQPKAAAFKTYCSRACAFADKAAKPKAPKAPKVIPMRQCVVCGSEMQSHNRNYCSEDCRKARNASRSRQREARLRSLSEHKCKNCGCTFVPVYPSKNRTFCSQDCLHTYGRRVAKAQRRARERALPYESVDPMAVFERDGWQCHICGGHVPSDLRGLPVDLAPELDHIIPLAKGGHHVWDNLGLAHRKCNQDKSDRISL